MGGGASKDECIEAGYYKETTEVGDVDDGFKVVDFHGSGLASFLLGVGLGAAATVVVITGWKKTMGRCAPRQQTHTHSQPPAASYAVADQAVALSFAPPLARPLALPAPPPAYTPAYTPMAPCAPPADMYGAARPPPPRFASPTRFEEVYEERARERRDDRAGTARAREHEPIP